MLRKNTRRLPATPTIIIVSGLWWTRMTAAAALRGDLLPALRNE